ncbi:2-hydroxyacid dehydrogenase [Trueperella bernardiae]|uniref:2-hydroxyacid dehydrogenase n=1 Tax=Trueperella bernardiae TaxID=59561 RepID=UPI00288A2751|nr:2-hydroxyacid dehydrogenase [Trueperella bernardiae]
MVKVLIAGDKFVTNDVLREALEGLDPAPTIVEAESNFPLDPLADIADVHEAVGDEDELIAALEGVDVCISHTMPFTQRVFDNAPDLKLVVIGRGGPVNVNLEAATKAGVIVANTPGRNATATTEHTVAMILTSVRQIAQRHSELARGDWRGDYYQFDQVGPELHGATVGVIGFGAIGSRVATIMRAFGSKVVVFDPYFTGELPEGISLVDDLDDLFRQSNVVTVHARATADNVGMIGRREIALMPENSILVNCARGSLIDFDALCDALDSGHLYAGALDVFPFEPLPADHRILNTPRLTVTPHLGGASKEAARIAARIGAEDIQRWLNGQTPKNVVNPEVLEGR